MARVVWALLALGCVPTEFEDLRGRAPAFAFSPPQDYAVRGFGEVVAGFGGELRGGHVSRVAVSAGGGSAFTVHAVRTGEQLVAHGGAPVFDGCDVETPCMAGAGVSLAGLVRWGEREMCVATPAPDSGEISIRCEDDVTRFEIASGPGSQRFGTSAAGVPADHPFGRAIFGAPGAASGRGAVYRLPDRASPVELDLSAGFGEGRELGTAVAVAVVDASTVVVAAGAPLGATKRVIVSRTEVAGRTLTTSVHGCLDDTSEAWGAALAVGDLNGDGAPEIVVGSGPGASRLEVVRVFDGASMPPAGTCDGSWTAALEIACPTRTDVDCRGGLFGATLAIGDVDGDGLGDLLVGAPGASVEGVAGAGAVLVFRGARSLAELERTIVAVRHSHPSSGAGIATSLAVVPGAPTSGGRRAEIVAGAPALDRVYVFVCSELDGDTPASTGSVRCQP